MSEKNQKQQLEAALDLMRRMPPSMLSENLDILTQLVPEIADDILQNQDCPLQIRKCKKTGKDYIICEYNRDGDSYRSPFSNEYDPPMEEGVLPSEKLREMEIQFNNVFKAYTQAYYERAVSSCYMWECDNGFACAILIKKEGSAERGIEQGTWDSIHVVEVIEEGKKTTYKLVTTIILSLKKNSLDLSGSIQKNMMKECEDKDHLANIGEMVEEAENKLRDQLSGVYFDKTKEITHAIRSPLSKKERDLRLQFSREMHSTLGKNKK